MLERVQRKAIRFIYNEYNLTSSPSQLINRAGLLTLENRAKLARMKVIYQLMHNMLSIDSSRYLSKSETRQTRHKHPHTLQNYRFSTKCFRFSFFPLATTEWNNLPSHIVLSPTLETFLQSYEFHLIASQI